MMSSALEFEFGLPLANLLSDQRRKKEIHDQSAPAFLFAHLRISFTFDFGLDH